ncbi:hypothetical protein HK097_004705, partial [Rhizophlyctis rosea]
ELLIPKPGGETGGQAVPAAEQAAGTAGAVEEEDEEPLLPPKKKAEVPEPKQPEESGEEVASGGIGDVEYARLEDTPDSVPPPKPGRKEKSVVAEESADGESKPTDGSKPAADSLI